MRMSGIQRRSRLTCPACGQQTTEIMPTDACQYFYDCPGCGVLLRPQPGDCCVFCSYGTVPCPPVQAARRAGRAPACCEGGPPEVVSPRS
jgi:hypothetical protein